MRKLGVMPSDLVPKKPEDFGDDFPDPKAKTKLMEHFEKKRLDLIGSVKKERAKIIKKEGAGKRRSGKGGDQEMSEMEKKHQVWKEKQQRELEKMKRRQVLEVERLIQNEIKMKVKKASNRHFLQLWAETNFFRDSEKETKLVS